MENHTFSSPGVTGITDIEIHFLQIKFTAIGVYLEPEIVGHLQQWKGKPGNVVAEDDDFFEALISGTIIFAIQNYGLLLQMKLGLCLVLLAQKVNFPSTSEPWE